MDGIRNKPELPDPADINLYKADTDTLAKFEQLPGDFKSACAAAVNSNFIDGGSRRLYAISIRSRAACAFTFPCSAAFSYHSAASSKSCSTPLPVS